MKSRQELNIFISFLFGVSFCLYASFRQPHLVQESSHLNNHFSEDSLHRSPVVLVKNENEESVPLTMNGLNISVVVTGRIAETTMEMTFTNGNDRILEGELGGYP